MRGILKNISSPADLKKLSQDERVELARELRDTIRATVGQTGGHLASNLGAVELTIALHTALKCPRDKLVFDVGHQCYAHKLLTGRQEAFERLRGEGGTAGFPKMSESEYDCFGVGHASTSVSAALGFARARDIRGEKYKVAALIGDGAMTGGLAYEALNDAGGLKSQFLVVLNDNEMSISRNVGALEKHLTRLRVSRKWRGTKRLVKGGLEAIPLIGRPISRALEWMKAKVRALIVPGSFFESLGFRYLGPIDGHDLEPLIATMRDALAWEYPTLLHVITQKGKGCPEAESEPEKYHGMPQRKTISEEQCDEEISASTSSAERSCASVAGRVLTEIAREDKSIIAITAAMPTGTGLSVFRGEHQKRFIDVGIAEEHAVTLAAGMAAAGLRPVVALYSTFLQRAVDQVIHDVCLQDLGVTFLIDHAGFVANDGATHQGLYDVCLLRSIPGLAIWTPSDLCELDARIREAVLLGKPCLIRYPKSLPERVGDMNEDIQPADRWRIEKNGTHAALLAYGSCLPIALSCADILDAAGISTAVVRASSVKPLDEEMVMSLSRAEVKIVTVEEGQRAGGFGSAVAELCADRGMNAPMAFGVGDVFRNEHTLSGLRSASGLTAQDIAYEVERRLRRVYEAPPQDVRGGGAEPRAN
ncbi:MAG: 1-deoxy-D-xylulose-5-phosphate synthase [Oscillospiraceae bacterium]|nr:1-deoxy-D-xylulose-5-phosphate synthase [Oscillospiraceae bacterium]